METKFRALLPEPAVDLSSDKGMIYFQHALEKGTARCFFRLIQQQSHQSSPAFCGLATLSTILNALWVDPHRKWKGIWRYYTEETLDCCISLAEVEKKGISFEELACLANCNGLEVIAKRNNELTLEEFRNRVIELTKLDTTFLAVGYSRKVLNQSGDGHWSPIGGYCEDSDMILILDQARFKYGAHWVPLVEFFKAMNTIDPDTNKMRGFFELSAQDLEEVGPPLAARVLSFGICGGFSHAREVIAELKDKLPKMFQEKGHDNQVEILKYVADFMMQILIRSPTSTSCSSGTCGTTTAILKQDGSESFKKLMKLEDNHEKLAKTQLIFSQLMKTKTGKIVYDTKFTKEQNGWRIALILSLDEDFWITALGEEAANTFFEKHQSMPTELSQEVKFFRLQLRKYLNQKF